MATGEHARAMDANVTPPLRLHLPRFAATAIQLAKVVGTDPATDIAVLKIDGDNLPFHGTRQFLTM